MTPKGDDMVRLDTETGDVSICARKDGDWACRAMPESEKSLRSDNDRLVAENKGLKDEIRRLEDTLGIGEPKPGDGSAASAVRPKLQLPTEEDVDKAFDYLEGMFRKFRDRLKRLDESRPDGTQL